MAEWQRRSFPIDGDPLEAARAEAARLDAEFPTERLRTLIASGGWDPAGPERRRALGMTAAQPVAVFVPSGRRGEIAAGTTVLDAARQLGVDLDSVCGGRGICGRCQVQPAFGEFAKHAITATPDHLSPRGTTEDAYHGRRPLGPGARLGCAARVLGDVVIDVPPESQVHRPVVRKTVDLTDLVIDPVVRLCYVEVDPGGLGEERSDLRLLLEALADQWSLVDLTVDLGVLADLQPALAEGKRAVTVAVHSGHVDHRRLAWFRRHGLRRGRRRRLHHHRRPPVRPGHRGGRGHRRRHEPPDPLRRGPDEPGLVRDDEPRR